MQILLVARLLNIFRGMNKGEIMIPECPLKVERAAQMLLHAYDYVQGLDPDGKTGAADLLWTKYEELTGSLTIRKSRSWVLIALLAAGFIMQLPLPLAAQQPQKDAGVGRCPVFGQIFGINPLAGTMLVKTPSGTIESLWFEQTTVFRAVAFDSSSKASSVPLSADAVNAGDWICASTGVNEKRAEIVLVAARQEIQNRQRETLARWLSASAFGTVIEIKPAIKNLVLESNLGGDPSGDTKRILVTASETTRFHRYRWDGTELGEIASASWAQVRVGQRICVHGTPSADGDSLDATSIIFGDLQAIAGTIGAINPLDETLRLNDLLTDQTVMIHISPGDLRLISPGPQGSQGSQGEDGIQARVLQAIDFGDIRKGDSVIVLGRQNMSWGTKIDGAVLIVNFGAPNPQSVSQKITWELVPVMLGQYLQQP
jgi:hypothetical protein